MDYDFGYNGDSNSSSADTPEVNNVEETSTDLSTGKIDNNSNGEPADDIDVKDTDNKEENKDAKSTKEENTTETESQADDNKYKLVTGSIIEADNNKYTVDENGNLVREDGSIFKEAKDVQAWIDEYDNIEDSEEHQINIDSIIKEVGVTITDDKDKPIEFDNSVTGVKEYIKAVIDSAREDNFETAINTLYERYPILNDVLNYYIANGNSLEGFGQVPDRSNITVDDSNEAQQEAIIRTAWSERRQKGDVESYIQYLKSSGILAATAKEELKGLQEADAQYRKELAEEAERKEEERIKELQKYWNGVHDVIKTRKIAGYQIPETIIINRNGQRLSATPEDFFNYIYRVNDKGQSAYMEDLAKETPESRRDDEILRAYLKFVGGNYSNLIDMAINNKEVEKLRLKAKERKKSSIKITNPKPAAKKGIDIDLGYN